MSVVTLVTEGRVEDKDVDLKGDSRFFGRGDEHTNFKNFKDRLNLHKEEVIAFTRSMKMTL